MRPLRPVQVVVNLMLGVQHHGDDFVPPKPQEYAEVLAISRFNLRLLHIWPEVYPVLVVIPQHPEHVVEFGSRDEHDAYPVMDDASGTCDGPSRVERLELLHFHFAALERRVSFRTLRFRKLVNPQQICPAP
ncbi:MAG: hypothetical protein DMG40_06970 [Acidobacteria bacterium]|nr:MAG: hypothetical protein DMG40_06970 [Acidobacteriota bacterium]